MKQLALILLFTGCHSADQEVRSSKSTTASGQAVEGSYEQTLWVTFSRAGADAVAEAMRSGQLTGSGARIASTPGVEAWQLQGVQPSDLSRFLHEHFHRCGGFVVHASRAEAEDALDETTDRFAESLTSMRYSIDQGVLVEALIDNVDVSQIHATIAHLSTGYRNRYYKNASGKQAAEWIAASWTALATGHQDIKVELFAHSWTQPSVIMTIPGSTLPDEVIVMGAHLDSIAGWSPGPDTDAPGADDDASGIASLTETVRVLLSSGFKPQRTLKIMGYAGEEAGLLGSQDIASKFAAEHINVVGVMQLDMTNYQDGGNDQIVLISDYTNQEQNAFIGSLIDTYVKVAWGQMTCDYACSDHASWTKRGYAASIPFETHDYNPNIHTADDTMANMVEDASHAAKFARLGIAYAVELGKGAVAIGP